MSPSDSDDAWTTAERSIVPSVLGLSPVIAVAIAAGLTALGVLVDLVRQGTLGFVFTVLYIAGCALAVAWVRRDGLFGPMVAPPLLLAVAVPAVVLLAGDPKPGTGMAEERGVGNVFNVPRGPGAPPARYVDDLWAAIVAATAGWPPDLVLVSAGFDAMLGDPLGGFTLEPEHYADLTRRLRERLPAAPCVGLLEGGYVPARLADGVLAHALALA